MKRVVVCLFITILSVSCVQIDRTGDELWIADDSVIPTAITLTKSEMQVSNKDVEFGINLFKDIYSLENVKSDMLISPFSASMLLSMLAGGANGETYSQIADALGFANLPASEIQSYYKKVTDRLVAPNGRVNLSIASAIWSGVPFKPDFTNAVKHYYNANLQKVDFSKNTEATKLINNWTNDQTHGMIDNFFEEPLSEGTIAILENVLYFKGQWNGEYGTRAGLFHDVNGNSTSTTFFGIAEYYEYDSYFDKEVSILQLSYKDNSYKMFIVLPAEGIGLSKFVSELSIEKWNLWKGRIAPHELKFLVPCFDANYAMSSNFVKALQNRGITLAFSEYADFSNMIESGAFSLDNMIQKTAIAINEKGSEVAAASVDDIYAIEDDEPSRFDFIADRPFIYAILEEGSGALLFMGVHVK